MSNDYQSGYDPNQNQSGYGQGGYGGGASPYPSSQPSSTDPASQSSASYGASNSWGDPVGQRSAGYVEDVHGQGMQGGQWAPQQDQMNQANQGGMQAGTYNQAGQYNQGQPGQGQTGQAPGADDNFFKALVDFNFTRYATPSVIKIFYIMGLVLGALYWLGGALMMMIMGSMATSTYSSSSDGGGVIAGFLWFLFGAPVYFFYIIALRVQLEYMLALVRTNQDTKAIRAKLDA